ncbi:MAG: hypothetical protein GYA22_13660 [Bacteroidales bacterium]|nr:hypothetical protein [Bacteroidales bacterium]
MTALTVKNGSDGLRTTFYRKNYTLVKSILIFIFLLVFTGNFPGLTESVQAQDTVPRITTDSVLYRHSPQRAMMLAAAFPGLGQIYNRKYWKAPLVYIGFGTLAYFVDFNNKKYQHFKKAYLYKIDGDPATVDIYEQYTEQSVKNAMDTYRRWRDMNLLGTAGFYVIQIIDATVDAYLFEYDITPDLSMHIVPDFRQIDYLAARSAGLRIVFNWK